MSNNDDLTDVESMRGNAMLERERRKRMQVEDSQQLAEERFKLEIAKAFSNDEILNGIAKEIRDAVARSERGEPSQLRRRLEGFSGMGVKAEDL
jgi:hypothetical protein